MRYVGGPLHGNQSEPFDGFLSAPITAGGHSGVYYRVDDDVATWAPGGEIPPEIPRPHGNACVLQDGEARPEDPRLKGR